MAVLFDPRFVDFCDDLARKSVNPKDVEFWKRLRFLTNVLLFKSIDTLAEAMEKFNTTKGEELLSPKEGENYRRISGLNYCLFREDSNPSLSAEFIKFCLENKNGKKWLMQKEDLNVKGC
ncbi:MAG: hypothetical protein WAX66_03550 [Patescibacteria group bacterium]